MVSHKKFYTWILSLTGFLIVVLVVLALAIPPLLNSEKARQKIQGLLAETIGASINYQQVDLIFSPTLALQIDQLEFGLPNVVSAQADRIQISPDLSQLILGEIAIDYLSVDNPDVHFDLTATTTAAPADPGQTGDTWQQLSQLLQTLASYIPDCI